MSAPPASRGTRGYSRGRGNPRGSSHPRDPRNGTNQRGLTSHPVPSRGARTRPHSRTPSQSSEQRNKSWRSPAPNPAQTRSAIFDHANIGSPAPKGWRNAAREDPATFKRRMAELYQTLKENREIERKKAIKDGLLADPDKPTSLANAITPVGTCQEMCPEFERVERMVQLMVDGNEKIPSSRNPNTTVPSEELMVKRFRRSAAGYDEQLPSDIRPPAVLKKTLDHLFDAVVGGPEPLAKVHKFVWDRTRGIRNDFSIQQVTKVRDLRIAIECFERIARFHILSLHQLSRPDGEDGEFDHFQEREQLNNTLLSLMYYYDDSRHKMANENEAEFRAYCIIFEIQDQRPDLEDRAQNWPDNILRNPRVKTALKLYAAAGNSSDDQGPLRPRTPFSLAQANYCGFFNLVKSKAVPYLMACVAEIYFNFIRSRSLETIWRAYKGRRPGAARVEDWLLHDVTRTLGFDHDDQTWTYCEEHGIGFQTREDGQQCLDLGSVSRGSLDDTNPRRKQTFSKRHVEIKRFGRSLPAIINGFSVSRAQAQDMIARSDVEYASDANSESLFLDGDSDKEQNSASVTLDPRKNRTASKVNLAAAPSKPAIPTSTFGKPSAFNPFIPSQPSEKTQSGTFSSPGSFASNPFATTGTPNIGTSTNQVKAGTSGQPDTKPQLFNTPTFTITPPSDHAQPAATTPSGADSSPFQVKSQFNNASEKSSHPSNPFQGFAGGKIESASHGDQQPTQSAFSFLSGASQTNTKDDSKQQQKRDNTNPFTAGAHPFFNSSKAPSVVDKSAAPTNANTWLPSTMFSQPSVESVQTSSPFPSRQSSSLTSPPTDNHTTQVQTFASNPPIPPPNSVKDPPQASPFGPGEQVSSKTATSRNTEKPQNLSKIQSSFLQSANVDKKPMFAPPAISQVSLSQSQTPTVTAPTATIQPLLSKPAPDRAREPDPRPEAIRRATKALVQGKGGLIQQYVEITIGPIIHKAFQQYQDDASWKKAREIRIVLLARKYARRWKANVWKLSLARKGKERRQKLAMSMQNGLRGVKRKIGANTSPITSESPAKRSSRPSMGSGVLKTGHPRILQRQQTDTEVEMHRAVRAQDIKRRRSEDEDKNVNAKHPKTSGHARANTVDETATSTARHRFKRHWRRPSLDVSKLRPGSLLADTIMKQARRVAPHLKSDSTKTDYFRLKALGLDPDTPIVPQTNKSPAVSTVQREKNGIVHDSSSKAVKITHSAGVNGDAGASGKAKLKAKASEGDGDEEFFASIKKIREALTESTSWFQNERQSLERAQSSNHNTARSSPVRHARQPANGPEMGANGAETHSQKRLRELQQRGFTPSRSQIRLKAMGDKAPLPPGFYENKLWAKKERTEQRSTGLKPKVRTEDVVVIDDDDDDDVNQEDGDVVENYGADSVEIIDFDAEEDEEEGYSEAEADEDETFQVNGDPPYINGHFDAYDEPLEEDYLDDHGEEIEDLEGDHEADYDEEEEEEEGEEEEEDEEEDNAPSFATLKPRSHPPASQALGTSAEDAIEL